MFFIFLAIIFINICNNVVVIAQYTDNVNVNIPYLENLSGGSLADLLRYSEERSSVNNFVNTQELQTFAKLVKSVHTFKTLSATNKKYTIFAPKNSAFKELPPFVLSYLQNNPKILEKVLTFHVVPGTFLVSDFQPNTVFNTVEGSNIKIRFSGRNIEVNNANLLKPYDLLGVDGILHLVDAVLIPDDVQLPNCNSRCEFVITRDSDFNRLSKIDRQKYCSMRCEKTSKMSEQQSQPQSQEYNGKIGLKNNENANANAEINTFAKEIIMARIATTGDNKIGNQDHVKRDMNNCAHACIDNTLLNNQGDDNNGKQKTHLNFLQLQLIERNCIQNCAGLFSQNKQKILNRKEFCIETCVKQGLDTKRCVLLCATENIQNINNNDGYDNCRGEGEVGGMVTSGLQKNCENVCSNTIDYQVCFDQCTSVKDIGDKDITSLPKLTEGQKAFFIEKAKKR